ncbi:MBL fold metallo-hydrolase [Carboxylicivirga sp. A043]|uniref:MBL fold metallo-hydrolase n=1 Tax=Carboxylicivirga litoralis TaxID=2816963 RepID=UPI0021CB6B36|nr:MBL fold metallo-hydrolase [Carboxylicivirga sp. A043]MCU4155793.1 MBL fold metallo-hydrolase [Carboxylicivirga sp. A043]
MIITISILSGIALSVVLFMALNPQFGARANKETQLTYEQSEQFRKGKFANISDVKIDMSGENFWAMMKEQFNMHPDATPHHAPNFVAMDSSNLADYNGDMRLFWFGHSSFLIQTNGKNILIDPMLGPSASPVQVFSVKRFNKSLPITIEQLPKIDIILISHDHYDHLDYYTIKKLKDKTDKFYTPLGVGAHLHAWGVDKSQITELDWWQELRHEDLTFACTPAQHFSGRGKWFNDQASTLWCSWVIKTNEKNIFFSGDSGYGDHFKAIGKKYGPFDLALMECGQYNELWKEIHMMPEETITAGNDIGAKAVMPIHWGVFRLAMHDWLEPITRASAKAQEIGMPVLTPQIGDGLILNGELPQTVQWWKTQESQQLIVNK